MIAKIIKESDTASVKPHINTEIRGSDLLSMLACNTSYRFYTQSSI